jgi:flagellar protein FlbT
LSRRPAIVISAVDPEITQFASTLPWMAVGREKDTVIAETANTPVKRLYLCVQTMYLKNDVPRYRTSYLGFVKELRDSQPGTGDAINAINQHVPFGALYKALKEIRKLMKREEERAAA